MPPSARPKARISRITSETAASTRSCAFIDPILPEQFSVGHSWSDRTRMHEIRMRGRSMKQEKTRAAGRIPAKETAVFCTQASLLLKAGVPAGRGAENPDRRGHSSGKGPPAADSGEGGGNRLPLRGGAGGGGVPLLYGADDPHRRAGGQAGRGSGGPEPLLRAGG